MKLNGPVFVPMGWLVAIVGASGTAILLSFSIGIWAASIKAEANAVHARVGDLETKSRRLDQLGNRLVRVETILAIKFPDAAEEARRQVPEE